jgi:hypothetical protein
MTSEGQLERARGMHPNMSTTFYTDDPDEIRPTLYRHLEDGGSLNVLQRWDESDPGGWIKQRDLRHPQDSGDPLGLQQITDERAHEIIGEQDGRAFHLFAIHDYSPDKFDAERQRQLRRNPPPRVRKYRFDCAECGNPAGTIKIASRLTDLPDRPGNAVLGAVTTRRFVEVERHGRGGVSMNAAWEPSQDHVIQSGDFAAMLRLDEELVRFVCLECWEPFCAEHLTLHPVYEGGGSPYINWWEGRCARGHTFMTDL